MKTIGVTGGTGFIGHHLTRLLLQRGYNVVIFTRSIKRSRSFKHITYAALDAEKNICDASVLQKLDAVIHLAGAGIADKRWTDKRKQEIVSSRVDGTKYLTTKLRQQAPNCHTFIAASAIGYYGPDRPGLIPFSEDAPPYTDFLAHTCMMWEHESWALADAMRTVILRFGIVLGRESGAFAEFEKPTRFGVAPILGLGTQVISWIEISDLAAILVFALENDKAQGIYNAVAPHPVTNAQMMQAIRLEKKGIQVPVHISSAILKILLGEMSTEVLKSCTVSNERISSLGFTFQYPDIQTAVHAILSKKAKHKHNR